MRAKRVERYDAYVRRAVVDASVKETCQALGVRPIPCGFPFLVSGTTGRVLEPAIAFLSAKYLVRQMPGNPPRMRHSPHSRTAAAADLNHFYDFLDAAHVVLEETDDEVIEGYAGSMLDQISLATGKTYAHQTVARRMSTLRKFLAWMQQEGRLPHRLQLLNAPTDEARAPFSESLKSGRLDGELEPGETINVLTFEEARAVLHSLGPLPSQAKARRSCRDRLAANIALDTGLRRSEVASLKVSDVSKALARAPRANVPFAARSIRVVGKGRRARKVLFPIWLLRELMIYIDGERKVNVDAGQKLFGRRFTDDGALFVNGANAATRRGQACSGDTLYQAFHKVQQPLVADGTLQQSFRFHDLRHTYATWTWVKLKRDGHPRPSKHVQAQLGHAHIETTEAIYLATVENFEAELFDDVARALDLRSGPYA